MDHPVEAGPPTKTLRKSRSLQELSAAKYLHFLEKDENAINTFNNLKEEKQQIVFPYIWQDYKRLLDAEGQTSRYQQRREYFNSVWRYSTSDDDEKRPPEDVEWVRWDRSQLIVTGDPDRPIALCCCWDKEELCDKAGTLLGGIFYRHECFNRARSAFVRYPSGTKVGCIRSSRLRTITS